MGDYVHEITHHVRGPTEGIVNYLNAHGKPEDVVAITYGDMALKFYTRMRVVGGFTGEDLTPALNGGHGSSIAMRFSADTIIWCEDIWKTISANKTIAASN